MDNKQLTTVFGQIDEITHEFNLSEEVSVQTKEIFQHCAENGLLVGHGIKSLMIVILSYVNSHIGNPLVSKEIEKKVNKPLKAEFKWLRKNRIIGFIPVISPINYVNKCLTKLNLPLTLEPLCIKMVNIFMDNIPNAKNVDPIGIITSIIYLVALQSNLYKEKRISQNEFAYRCGVTAITIRNRITDVLTLLPLIPEFVDFDYEKTKTEKIKCGEEWRHHLI